MYNHVLAASYGVSRATIYTPFNCLAEIKVWSKWSVGPFSFQFCMKISAGCGVEGGSGDEMFRGLLRSGVVIRYYRGRVLK